jgi:hypothetical protein
MILKNMALLLTIRKRRMGRGTKPITNNGFPSSPHPTNISSTPPNTAHDAQNDPP